jgi:hypothetical protein
MICPVAAIPTTMDRIMSKQKFALINRATGVLIGLTDSNVDTPSLDSWALDEECIYFLEALQAYTPKHIFTVDDIKWYYHICETRTAFDWDLLPKADIMLNNILSSNLKFDTYYPVN